jgi:hypothetical protein
MRQFKRWAWGAPVALLACAAAHAAPLTNGDFEGTLGIDSSTSTFANWSESNGNTAIAAPTPLSGSQSAQLVGSAAGSMFQTPTAISGVYSITAKFAGVDPGGSAARVMNLIYGQSGAGSQVNLRVIEGTTSPTTLGSLQVFDTSFNNWRTLLPDAVPFSTSLSTPTVNTLSIDGTAGGAYTVKVNAATSASVSYYQNGAPASIGRIEFHTDNGTNGTYVVDDVTLAPEPGSIVMLGVMGGAGLLARRRRRA